MFQLTFLSTQIEIMHLKPAWVHVRTWKVFVYFSQMKNMQYQHKKCNTMFYCQSKWYALVAQYKNENLMDYFIRCFFFSAVVVSLRIELINRQQFKANENDCAVLRQHMFLIIAIESQMYLLYWLNVIVIALGQPRKRFSHWTFKFDGFLFYFVWNAQILLEWHFSSKCEYERQSQWTAIH